MNGARDPESEAFQALLGAGSSPGLRQTNANSLYGGARDSPRRGRSQVAPLQPSLVRGSSVLLDLATPNASQSPPFYLDGSAPQLHSEGSIFAEDVLQRSESDTGAKPYRSKRKASLSPRISPTLSAPKRPRESQLATMNSGLGTGSKNDPLANAEHMMHPIASYGGMSLMHADTMVPSIRADGVETANTPVDAMLGDRRTRMPGALETLERAESNSARSSGEEFGAPAPFSGRTVSMDGAQMLERMQTLQEKQVSRPRRPRGKRAEQATLSVAPSVLHQQLMHTATAQGQQASIVPQMSGLVGEASQEPLTPTESAAVSALYRANETTARKSKYISPLSGDEPRSRDDARDRIRSNLIRKYGERRYIELREEVFGEYAEHIQRRKAAGGHRQGVSASQDAQALKLRLRTKIRERLAERHVRDPAEVLENTEELGAANAMTLQRQPSIEDEEGAVLGMSALHG